MPDFRRKNNNFNAINQNINKPNTGSNLSDMQLTCRTKYLKCGVDFDAAFQAKKTQT